MLLNRRGFFGTLAAAAAGLVLDPERLLWVPGQKMIFLPTVQRFSANTFITAEWVTRDTANFWRNSTKINAAAFNRLGVVTPGRIS